MTRKERLTKLAEDRAVDIEPGATIAEIELALHDSGVDPSEADPKPETKTVEPIEEAPEEVEDDNEYALLKMTRQNNSFQTLGYRFTREHPYVPVKKSHVDHLVTVEGGFAIATENEVREYYN